jgi:hypothetical protein
MKAVTQVTDNANFGVVDKGTQNSRLNQLRNEIWRELFTEEIPTVRHTFNCKKVTIASSGPPGRGKSYWMKDIRHRKSSEPPQKCIVKSKDDGLDTQCKCPGMSKRLK